MARGRNPPSSSLVLTAEQIRHRIERLQACIQELQEFKPELVQKRYNIAEVDAVETSIRDALITAFGDGTPHFNLYEKAAHLALGPHFARTAPPFGRGPAPDYDAQEAPAARQYLAEGKERSILLLRRAIETLEDQIADHMEATAPPPFQPLVSGQPRPKPSRKVFVVHGHDKEALQSVARFLEKLGLEAIILNEQPGQGRTIIEKFEDYAGEVGFAVVLLTPDDIAGTAAAPGSAQRARQNVIFELGYFAGKLGRGRACLLRKGAVEIPSDLYGVIYTEMDDAEGWKVKLVKEFKAAKLDFDANRMWE
jgi:predicted nucleotide-binding protein